MLCLAIAWTFAFFCVFRGVKSIGKVVYFTATFPYAILTALLVRALTMDGSSRGILYFITPVWNSLASAAVWADATSQVFFSFGIAWGTLIVLASFNRVNFMEFFLSIFFNQRRYENSSKTIAILMRSPCRLLIFPRQFTMELWSLPSWDSWHIE